MLIFWIITAAMLALALGFIIPPLLGRSASPGRLASNLPAAIGVGIAVPAACLGLYLWLGEPLSMVAPDAASSPAASQAGDQPSIGTMVEGLARRLQSMPDDPEGWMMLGRSYLVLERFAEGRDAYRRAYELIGEEPGLLVNLAEATALSNDNRLAGVPTDLLARALELDPDNQKGLWLAGFAAMQRGDADAAVRRWEHLLEIMPPDSEKVAMVRGLIATAAVPSASSGASEAAEGSTPISIEAMVRLHPNLQGRVNGNETLFVFARAASGPPMPLAIERRTSAELPVTIVLDDSMGMVESLKLSSFETVVVGARISTSGDALPRGGDLQGLSAPLRVSGKTKIELVIDEVVP